MAMDFTIVAVVVIFLVWKLKHLNWVMVAIFGYFNQGKH